MTAILNNLSLIVNLMLGFAGLVCVIFLIIGGYRIASSGDDPQSYQGGKTTLKNAIIGTVIVIFAVPMGNFFVAQITGDTGVEAPPSVSTESLGAIEAPSVNEVVAHKVTIGTPPVEHAVVLVTFSEPVIVYTPAGVKIASTNLGALNLRTACVVSGTQSIGTEASGPVFPTSGSQLTLCFASDNAPTVQSRATGFIFGRGSSIRDEDDNASITAFPAISLN